ncbi:hypothetical protein BH10PSE7_BH10PSE7_08650 [soil metagenome]
MPPHTFVVMSVYRPHTEYIRVQIDSILAQEHRDLTLLALIDGPDAGDVETRSDPRFLRLPQPSRLGITGNFLRGLAAALAMSRNPSDLFAFSDQDDVWMPRKLSTLIAAMREGAVMAYSDARVIDAVGKQIVPSLFALEGRRPHRTFGDLLLVNDVSGMSMLFTRACAARAVHWAPPGSEPHLLHDWWVALIAHLAGDTAFVNDRLLAYRRHERNAVGPALAGDRPRKRAFLSPAYRAMCVAEWDLRRRVWTALAEIAVAEKLPPLPPFDDILSPVTLMRHLLPPGSQQARAATRLLLARLWRNRN